MIFSNANNAVPSIGLKSIISTLGFSIRTGVAPNQALNAYHFDVVLVALQQAHVVALQRHAQIHVAIILKSKRKDTGSLPQPKPGRSTVEWMHNMIFNNDHIATGGKKRPPADTNAVQNSSHWLQRTSCLEASSSSMASCFCRSASLA